MKKENSLNITELRNKNRFPNRENTLKYTSEVEEAVRAVHRRQLNLLPSILIRRGGAKIVRFALRRALRPSRRSRSIAKAVQKGRLSARRQFFTSGDVKRAVFDTTRALRKLRGDRPYGR